MRRILAFLCALLFLLPLAAAYGVTFYNPAWNPQDGLIFEKVLADTPYVFEIDNEEIALTRITFTIERDAKNAGLTVYNLRSIPDFLPDVPENDSYEFNEIKYSGFVPHDTKKFLYDFRVEKSWLEDKGVPRNAVALHAYDRVLEEWEALPTDVVSDDEDFVYFTAADDGGVHHLFIGKMQGYDAYAEVAEEVEEVSEEAPLEEDVPEEEIDEEPSDVALETGVTPVQLEKQQPGPEQVPSTVPATTGPDVTGVEPDEESRLLGILILLALVVIAVVLYLVFGRKRLGYSVDKELDSYIRESIKRGKSVDEIKERLLEVGWHHGRIERVLAKYKRHSKTSAEPSAKSPEKSSGLDSGKSMSLAEAKALAEKQKKEVSKKNKGKAGKKSSKSKKK